MGFALEEIRVERLYKQLCEDYEEIKAGAEKHRDEIDTTIVEGVTDGIPPNVFDGLAEVAKRLEAARRGLGIVNKLPVGEQRSQHRSKIMSNLNRIRAMFNAITKSVAVNLSSEDTSKRYQEYSPADTSRWG